MLTTRTEMETMHSHTRIPALILGVSVAILTGCAVTVPQEMKLADPVHRIADADPGTNLNAMRLACADTMLKYSPANEAFNIDSQPISQGETVTIEVNAVLKNVGMWREDLPITFRCEYQQGKLASTRWTRGLK